MKVFSTARPAIREKNVLYPKLDEVLSPDERRALLAACGRRAES